MRDGEKIRIIGSGGAPALITVGQPFELPEIKSKLATGEWQLLTKPATDDGGKPPATGGPVTGDGLAEVGEQPPATALPAVADAGRPPQNAPKADWIDYVVRSRLMSREDAANYTKQDLIDMVS